MKIFYLPKKLAEKCKDTIYKFIRRRKVMQMYRKASAQKFQQKNLWWRKKSLVGIGFLVLVAGFIVSINYKASQNFTVEMLIDKAQAAATLKATQGKYYYQRIEAIYGAKGSTEKIPEIEEFWKDSSSNDFLLTAKDPQTNKFLRIELFQKGTLYFYSGDGLLISQNSDDTELGRLATWDVNAMMRKGLKDFLEGKGNVDIHELFPLGTGRNVTSFSIGEKKWEGTPVKFLDIEFEDKVETMSLYFDAQTFDLLYVENFNNQLQKPVASVKVLNSEFSDTVPLIHVGGTVLGLEIPASQHLMKTFENEDMRFQYPDFYTVQDKRSSTQDDATREEHLQLTRQNSEDTIDIIIAQGKGLEPILSNGFMEFHGEKFFRIDYADGYSYNLFHNNKQFTFYSHLDSRAILAYPFNDSLQLIMQSLEMK